MDLAKNNSEIVRAAWTAMDQTYGTVAPGYGLQPIDNGGQGRTQPWATPSGFIVAKQVTEMGIRAACCTAELQAVPRALAQRMTLSGLLSPDL